MNVLSSILIGTNVGLLILWWLSLSDVQYWKWSAREWRSSAKSSLDLAERSLESSKHSLEMAWATRALNQRLIRHLKGESIEMN